MFSKILIGTDFSSNARSAMFAGISIAVKCLARIEMVHVISYLEDIYRASRFVVPDANWQKETLDRMEEFFPNRLYPNNERHVLVGNSVPQTILKHGRETNCDLIVIGTKGRSAVAELLMGGVAHQVARGSEIPVMIVRDEKHGRPVQGFNRVLVPTDFSPESVKALKFGVNFADFLKADLHLVHVIDESEIRETIYSYPQYDLKMPESCEINVDDVLQAMLPKDLTGEGKVASLVGVPSQAILHYCEEHSIDFIVMGTHGRKGLERLLLGSVTASVIANSKVPVITLSA